MWRLLAKSSVFHHLGGTATGNIWMTATLAIITMVMMVVNGLRLGGTAYLAHFCPGPIWMAPLLVPVEIIGLIAKVFALAGKINHGGLIEVPMGITIREIVEDIGDRKSTCLNSSHRT